MTQATNLLIKYDPASVFSFTVGSVAIVAHRLYKRHTDDTLIVAGDNENAELFLPLSAEGVGLPVSAIRVAAGATVVLTASGSISKDGQVAPAADGKIRAATTGDRVVGRVYWDASDGELCSVMFGAGGAVLV